MDRKKKLKIVNELIRIIGDILLISGIIGTFIGLFIYPIYAIVVCSKFSIKWLLHMLLKWFVFTEGSAVATIIGWVIVKIKD